MGVDPGGNVCKDTLELCLDAPVYPYQENSLPPIILQMWKLRTPWGSY